MAQLMDGGERRTFSTGAVRDIGDGKGRCDLLPLMCITTFLPRENTQVLVCIQRFIEKGNEGYLYSAVNEFCKIRNWSRPGMLLEVSKQFEDGAKKYGENNWQKGIPIHCYIDSAIRHYIKFCDQWEDEPHDRAFCWNIICAIWTLRVYPELDDINHPASDDC